VGHAEEVGKGYRGRYRRGIGTGRDSLPPCASPMLSPHMPCTARPARRCVDPSPIGLPQHSPDTEGASKGSGWNHRALGGPRSVHGGRRKRWARAGGQGGVLGGETWHGT
jgi:hypothetical protein